MTKIEENVQQKIFFLQKFSYLLASVKDVQATGEAFSPQTRTSSTSKDEIINCFIFFWAIFALLDPDPQHCLLPCGF
jgi:hypothetical protein